MDKELESELKNSLQSALKTEAIAAKAKIAKYFKHYGATDHRYQLMFTCKIMYIISKSENKHIDVYCSIITEIFSDRLHPEASVKYWTLYVNCVRCFHYLLLEEQNYAKATSIYKHISSYNNKLQSSENGLTYINIYCYQLFLYISLKSKKQDFAVCAAIDVIENLTKLFNDVLETNKKLNFQYPEVLTKTMSWLFPQPKAKSAVYHFLKTLPQEKVKKMFQTLFTLYGRQTMGTTSNENDIQEHSQAIFQTIYTLLQFDVMDKMQLKLTIELLDNCHTDSRLKTNNAIAKSFQLIYDYLKLLCDEQPTKEFQSIYSRNCEHFKQFFEQYSKSIKIQPWFSDYLLVIFYIHSQLQNVSIFSCFWKQMYKPHCFKSMLQFFVELLKLAPCISSESKLLTINCCLSTRKHVILSFSQIALTAFVFYCQNVSEDDEKLENVNNTVSDYYKEMIQNNVVLIINHAFKIIDKMDCIASNSPEVEIILTRFKQATVACKTHKQAVTCISICELFLKIKNKIASKEWPLLLRRLYKTVTQMMKDEPRIGREIQMCYIASLLHNNTNEMDINQIRTQISIFYANETTLTNTNEQQSQLQHDHCLLQLYHTTTSVLRPHLEPSCKKLLHWLESQHILKYYKSNTALLHSILKYSQSQYDFVLITKLGKLQPYAMAKIASLYKHFRTKAKESCNLSRLEQLTFGHLCAMLLNDTYADQKFQIDSKHLSEEQLENLFLHEEMSSITLQNDLKRFKLGYEALKAFNAFYEKFDSESITLDDAIIDWESILDDLSSIALCFQLAGFTEHSSQAWHLHYKCSRLIQDDFSALRGLAFFCEHSEHCENKSSVGGYIELEKEIQHNFPTITQGLENLANLQRNAYQNYVLLATVHIAHYYARTLRFSFAQMLLQYVQQKHAALAERQGRYDIVLATMDVIKFRLLWKHFPDSKNGIEEKVLRSTAENLLLHRCLFYEVEEMLDRLHDFSYISSCDSSLYMILIINLVQELAECTANRLCDNFINPLFIAACKCALLAGLALRFMQIMSMWMWVNLQMEYVDKAQVKLKIIEYVMGTKSLQDMAEKNIKKLNEMAVCSDLLTPNSNNRGIETLRKLAQVQLSPINTDKLQLSPSHRNSDLSRYFEGNIYGKLVPQNDQIDWTFFMVGCLNARLYFLVKDYNQLDAFYERGVQWIQMRENSFNKIYYKNIQLMAMQHYANFLRARGKYGQALKCLEDAIEFCKDKMFYVDAAYYVNFELQLIATKKELSDHNSVKVNLPTHSKLRRALEFNLSPEDELKQKSDKKTLKEYNVDVLSSGKNPSAVVKSLSIHAIDSGCSSTKKTRTRFDVGSIMDLDTKSTKPKKRFEICEDSLEIISCIDLENFTENIKSIKRTKMAEEVEEKHKTPKVVRKTTRSSKTTGTKKPASKIKRPELKPKFCIDTSPLASLKKTSKSSSLENLAANDNELLRKMRDLEIKSSKKTIKSSKSQSNLLATDEPAAIVTIVIEDSPCTKTPSKTEVVKKPKSSRTRATTKVLNGQQPTNEDTLATNSRPRRQRQLMLNNSEEENSKKSSPPLTVTPSVTKKRQNNLL